MKTHFYTLTLEEHTKAPTNFFGIFQPRDHLIDTGGYCVEHCVELALATLKKWAHHNVSESHYAALLNSDNPQSAEKYTSEADPDRYWINVFTAQGAHSISLKPSQVAEHFPDLQLDYEKTCVVYNNTLYALYLKFHHED